MDRPIMTAPPLSTRAAPARTVTALWAALIVLLAGAFALPSARAADKPEAFVQALADEAVGILRDETADPQARYGAFRTLILGNTDLDRIAGFVLGRYAGEMRKSERYPEYVQLFREYVVRIYAARLGQYSGEKLIIDRTLQRNATEVIVYSSLDRGAAGGDPIAVNWRLRQNDGALKIIDVQIAGAWMAIEQRDQFTSIINNNKRDPLTLIDFLRREVQSQGRAS